MLCAITALLTLGLMSSARLAAVPGVPGQGGSGWTALFDGKTLAGWTPSGDADWAAKDGAITFATGRGMLVSTKVFDNFELQLDFNGEPTANSGVFLRCPELSVGRPTQTTCYEVNIFDSHETDPTGSIVGVKSVLPERPATAGKWNTYDILAEGTHLVIKLNGKTMVDARDDKLKLVRGTIALQAAGPGGPGTIKFRNIRVRAL